MEELSLPIFILLNSWVIFKCFKGKSRYRKFIKKLQVELVEKFKEGQKKKKEKQLQVKRKQSAERSKRYRERKKQMESESMEN